MKAGDKLKSRIALFLMILAAPVMMGATDLESFFGERILAVHNRERATQGIGPLSWNNELANSAQRWADHLAASGTFQHAPERASNPQGENLWAGTKGYYSLEARINAWIREKQYFRQGTFPDNSVTGKVADVGHYTQLMWRQTHEVGCAQATGVAEDVLVCRYSSAGNYLGEQVF